MDPKKLNRRQFIASTAALAGGGLADRRARKAPPSLVLLSDRGRRSDHKIIDGYAAEFEKANPAIKVKPIYSGTYQESITRR